MFDYRHYRVLGFGGVITYASNAHSRRWPVSPPVAAVMAQPGRVVPQPWSCPFVDANEGPVLRERFEGDTDRGSPRSRVYGDPMAHRATLACDQLACAVSRGQPILLEVILSVPR